MLDSPTAWDNISQVICETTTSTQLPLVVSGGNPDPLGSGPLPEKTELLVAGQKENLARLAKRALEKYYANREAILRRRKERWKANREARCEELRRRYQAKQEAIGLSVKSVRRKGTRTPEIIKSQELEKCRRYEKTHRLERLAKQRSKRAQEIENLKKNNPTLLVEMRRKQAAYHHMYRKREKDKRRKWGLAYTERHKHDPHYVMSKRLRSRIRVAVTKGYGVKAAASMELVGCSIPEVKQHLENQFTNGMTWQRFLVGEIEIDHIRPCASFDLSKADEQRRCFHYTNLQPLWWQDNLAKGDKIL